MPSSMPSQPDLFDSELLLKPEEHYYEEGFREGQSKSTREDYLEGKQLGIQTGFQRFLMVGGLRRLVIFLQSEIDDKLRESGSSTIIMIKGKERNYERVSKQLSEVITMLDFFLDSEGRVNVKNTTEEVSELDKIFKQSRAKVRSLCSKLGYSDVYQRVERSCAVVGGEIPTEDVKGADNEIW